MTMLSNKKNKLYYFLLLLISLGYTWVFYSWNKIEQEAKIGCLFKKITTYPCPSCGTTRATILGFKGEWLSSVLMNPFGILVVLIMILVPIWISFDWIFKKESFFQFYKRAEQFITQKYVASFLILVVLLNWYWNFKKNL